MMIRAWRHAVIALLETTWWTLMMVPFLSMKVLALVRQPLTQIGTSTFQMKRFFHPHPGIRIPQSKTNQIKGSHGKCQASESPETESPPGVKLQLLLRHQAGDRVEAEVTTEKVIAVKTADALRLLGQTGKTWRMYSLLRSLVRLLQGGETLYPACLIRLSPLLPDGETLYPACMILPMPLPLHKGETLRLLPGPAIPDRKGAPTRILLADLRVSFVTFLQIQTLSLHLPLYFFNADFSIAPFPMVRLDNRSNTFCWFNSSVIGTIFLARSCNRACPPAENLDCFMAHFAMWYNQENSTIFYPQLAIRQLIQEMTVRSVHDVMNNQQDSTLFFNSVGGRLLDPPEVGAPEPKGLEFFDFMKPIIGETTMPYRCRHCQEKGNAKIFRSVTVFSIN